MSVRAQFDMQLKLLTIGDGSVGKTCLLLRYSNDSYTANVLSTIGIDFKVKNLKLDDKRIKLQIWDTAGQERFRTITTAYFRGSQGILLVYDITSRQSFNSIRNWVEQIKLHADVNVNKVLVGNKCDMNADRAVTLEEGEALAKEYDIPFFEASAKDNINVEEAFLTLAKSVKARMLEEGLTGMTVNAGHRIVDKSDGKKKGRCC